MEGELPWKSALHVVQNQLCIVGSIVVAWLLLSGKANYCGPV